MKLILAFLIVFALCALRDSGSFAPGAGLRAQSQDQETLSRQLKAGSVEELAAEVRAKGNPVQGAILFAQQNINCIKCHSSGEQNLLGPDLTRMEKDVTDVYLVESLLEPSRSIRKGYESFTVLLQDGRTVAGRIVEQNPAAIVLRDAEEVGKQVTINRSEIDAIAPNRLSMMADGLIDELAGRQQFLDLAMYIMTLADAGPLPPASQPQTISQNHEILSDEIRGLALIDQLNCAACHENNLNPDLFAHRQAPHLAWGSGRIDPDFIERFVVDPAHVHPGSSMPNVMHGLEPEQRKAAARAITQYLVSLGPAGFSRQPLDPLAATRGREKFHRVGCVACHSRRSDGGVEQLADTSVPLGNVARKYNLTGLAEFLENPLAVRPSGRMPSMALSHWESVDIAHFLLQDSEGSRIEPEPYGTDQALIAEGKELFQRLSCVNCHALPDATIGVSKTGPRPPPLANLQPDRGCLSKEPGAWPRYQFDDSQRGFIRTALGRKPAGLTTPDQIVLTMHSFNCLACHQRGSLGGVPSSRIQYFRTTNENIGPQSRIPPTLTGVGGKLNSKWLREVLVTGRAIRPYLETRMPQYGADHVAHLVPLLAEADRLPEGSFAAFTDQEAMKKAGHRMAGNTGLNCVACHTFQQLPGETMPAVDLTNMAERLHKEWFYNYMRDPQRHSPNTVMPSFWPGGRAMRKDILDGDADLQIEALWQYLLEDRQAATPAGLINEPIELFATSEAVMLRRSYNGLGKRGIGVGLPGGLNLAFDAEQMRLAMIWKGKFADASGVWKGQGSGTVRPLGNDLLRFEGGPDLDDAIDPWLPVLAKETEALDQPLAQDVRIRSPRHQFRGYFLDDLQRPVFMYRFDGVDVEDYSIDVPDEQTGAVLIRRTLTFTSKKGRPNTRFRAATGETIVAGADGSFLIGDKLRLDIVCPAGEQPVEASILDAPWGKQLLVPVVESAGKSVLTLEYRW